LQERHEGIHIRRREIPGKVPIGVLRFWPTTEPLQVRNARRLRREGLENREFATIHASS
jgi:hypothetical protein